MDKTRSLFAGLHAVCPVRARARVRVRVRGRVRGVRVYVRSCSVRMGCWPATHLVRCRVRALP